ncbi:Lsm12p [Sporobolomyces salmoneus]|uniref:Lsm12p n=1 Tax=Sporobolomyces salmoneus TaxID=183962 RepID=UPI0031810E7F
MSSRSSTPKLSTSKQTPAAVSRSNASSPAPSSSSSSSSPLPDLSTLLNLPIEITTVGPNVRTIKATLYTYDPITSILILSTPSTSPSSSSSQEAGSAFTSPRSYHLLKTSQIASVSVLSSVPDPLFPSPSSPLPSPPSLSASSLSQKVSQSVSTLQKDRARIGPPGTPSETQTIYDSLSKTLPVRWTEGGQIVVMDEVVVDPKEGWSVKGGKGSRERIERVGKVLEGIRARVAANGGSQTPVIG